MVLGYVGFQGVSGGTEFLAMGTDETSCGDVACLNVVLTSGLVLGGVPALITAKQTTVQLEKFRLNGVIEG